MAEGYSSTGIPLNGAPGGPVVKTAKGGWLEMHLLDISLGFLLIPHLSGEGC